MKGIVKNFNREKGFGFITPLIGKPGAVEDLWFHACNVRSSRGRVEVVPRGAECHFVITRGEKGLQAADITLIELQPRMKRESSPETDPAIVPTTELLRTQEGRA